MTVTQKEFERRVSLVGGSCISLLVWTTACGLLFGVIVVLPIIMIIVNAGR